MADTNEKTENNTETVTAAAAGTSAPTLPTEIAAVPAEQSGPVNGGGGNGTAPA